MSDPDFQKIFTDEEDDVFTYAVSASDVTIVCRIINGDGTVMTERTLE